MSRRKYKHSKNYSTSKSNLAIARFLAFSIVAIFVIFCIIGIIGAAKPYALVIRNIAIVLLVIVISWFGFRWGFKYYKNQKITGELETYLQKALESMDQESNYSDEIEANRELATALRTQGLTVEREYRLSERRIADLKVRDVIIEGKLSPKTDEVDRLLGQLQDYCTYKFKVNIVIFGNLDNDSLKRISDEINNRYPKKAFLTYLKNPHRNRVDRLEPNVVIKKYYRS